MRADVGIPDERTPLRRNPHGERVRGASGRRESITDRTLPEVRLRAVLARVRLGHSHLPARAQHSPLEIGDLEACGTLTP